MNRWGTLAILVVFQMCVMAMLCVAPSLADHESSMEPPLRTSLDEPERLALLQVPDGMVEVPAGEFLMGSDSHRDRAAGPQELPTSYLP